MKKIIYFCSWRKVRFCLILSTTLLCFTLISCSTPNSVRSGNNIHRLHNYTEEQKKEAKKELKNNQIEAAEKLYEKMGKSKDLESEKDITVNPVETDIALSRRKIPSLREQMKIYSEQQDKMLDKFTYLERDIESIKNDIEDIKITIKAILANQTDKTAIGIYGEDKQKNEQKDNLNNQTGFYLYPDETEDESRNENSSKKQFDNDKLIHKNNNSKKNKTIATEKPSEKNLKSTKISKEESNNTTIPTFNSSEFDLAMDYLGKRDFQKAVAELLKLEINQKNSSAKLKTYYWLGEGYFGLGDYNKAIEYFKKVVKSSENYKKDYATIMIAESYLRIGRIEEAKKSYAKFVDEYPNSNQIPRAKKMLQQL